MTGASNTSSQASSDLQASAGAASTRDDQSDVVIPALALENLRRSIMSQATASFGSIQESAAAGIPDLHQSLGPIYTAVQMLAARAFTAENAIVGVNAPQHRIVAAPVQTPDEEAPPYESNEGSDWEVRARTPALQTPIEQLQSLTLDTDVNVATREVGSQARSIGLTQLIA